jgi:hypothetical protein
MTAPEVIFLELEIDPPLPDGELFAAGVWRGDGIVIELQQQEDGHGFGFSEVVTVALSIAGGVTSDLAADAVRQAVRKVIRKARGTARRSDGSPEGLRDLIESERAEPAPEDRAS